MKVFLANGNRYDHYKSFSDNGFIDWTQGKRTLSLGEIVLIKSTTENRVIFVTRVDKTNMDFKDVFDDKVYWQPNYLYQHEQYKKGKYCRLTLISQVYSDYLSDNELLKQGITLSDKKEVSSKDLDYIKSVIPIDENEENAEKTYVDGKLVEVKLSKYERNQEARQKCLDHYGYKCQVCDFDFESTYGTIGKSFIHVHHINPISNIKEEHQINPITDLIPVCPNCHIMLHKKGKREVFTIIELKDMMKSQIKS